MLTEARFWVKEKVMLTGAESEQRDHRGLSTPPSNSSPDEQLDIQKALQIVSEHYGKRNAVFLSCYLIMATLYGSSLWQGPELALKSGAKSATRIATQELHVVP